MITVERLTNAKEGMVKDIELLLSQLRTDVSEHATSLSELEKIVQDKNVAFVVAKDGERIVGMASLYIINKCSKRSASIEDVVVDENYRGQKLGEKLTQALISVAREEGVGTIHLTSRPERVAANKLYQKLGFQLKETNAYRLSLRS